MKQLQVGDRVKILDGGQDDEGTVVDVDERTEMVVWSSSWWLGVSPRRSVEGQARGVQMLFYRELAGRASTCDAKSS